MARKATVQPVRRRTAPTPRRSEKPRGSGIGRFLLGFLAFMLVCWFGGRPIVRSVAAHPVFTVTAVDVRGAEYLDLGEIRNASGIAVGRSLFDIDLAQVAKQLSRSFAAEDFTVYRVLPGTIVVEVCEQTPVALLNVGTLVGVDRNGHALPHVGASLVGSLPIITGVESIAALADSTVKERLVKGLRLLESINQNAPSTYKRISEVHVADMNMLGVSLIDSGLEIIVGQSDWTKKIPELDRIVTDVAAYKQAVKALDIRFSELVVVR